MSQINLHFLFLAKCSDWILDVTDEEEREDLEYLLRTQRVEVLRERITELLTRFDDKTRTQVSPLNFGAFCSFAAFSDWSHASRL